MDNIRPIAKRQICKLWPIYARFIPLLATVLCCNEALAGPWSRPAREGLLIPEIGHEWNNATAIRAGLYAEYGIGAKWTALGKVEMQAERDREIASFWRLGARRQFTHGDIVIGGEAHILSGVGINSPVCGSYGGEARFGVGRNFSLASRPGFAVLETALNYYGQNCLRYRLDAVLGWNITPRWRPMAKTYVEFDNEALVSLKIEGVVYYVFGAGKTLLGIGYRRETGGRFAEQAVFTSAMQVF